MRLLFFSIAFNQNLWSVDEIMKNELMIDDSKERKGMNSTKGL